MSERARSTTSRRRFLVLGVGTAFGALALAACGGAATPTVAPTSAPASAPPPKPTTAPAAAATTAPSGGAATPAAAATTAPAAAATSAPAAGAAPAATKPAAGASPKGPVTAFVDTDYLPETTQLMKAIMDDYAKKNGIEFNFEEKSGNWQDQLKAAVQAGTPPDLMRIFDYQAQYWRGQNQAADVSDVVAPLKTQQGGFFDYVEKVCGWQGKWYAVPYAVNAWPMHVRQDLLDQKGLKWPAGWDEFRTTAKQIQNPPNLYAFGYTLGRTNDTNNHFLALLWTFGGQLQDENGKLGVTSASDKAWIQALTLTKQMFEEDKIIPPGAVSWDDGGNNNAYQGGQVWATSNPTSIYGWLVKNKPELAKGTKFYPYPKGPAGEFGQVDVWGMMLFKASKAPDAAKAIIGNFADPAQYTKYIDDMKGRFLPVYKNLLDRPLWKSDPLFEQYTTIAKNGRIMAYNASPTAPYGDITTTFVIGDMMQDLLVKKQQPEQALQTFITKAKAIYDKYPNL